MSSQKTRHQKLTNYLVMNSPGGIICIYRRRASNPWRNNKNAVYPSMACRPTLLSFCDCKLDLFNISSRVSFVFCCCFVVDNVRLAATKIYFH